MKATQPSSWTLVERLVDAEQGTVFQDIIEQTVSDSQRDFTSSLVDPAILPELKHVRTTRFFQVLRRLGSLCSGHPARCIPEFLCLALWESYQRGRLGLQTPLAPPSLSCLAVQSCDFSVRYIRPVD